MLLHHPQLYDHFPHSAHHQSPHRSLNSQPRDSHPPSPTAYIPLSQQFSHRFPSLMPTSQQTLNPTVRVRPSTASPPTNASTATSAQGASYFDNYWGSEDFKNTGYLDISPRKGAFYHKRLSSGSSVDSPGPPSPHDQPSPSYEVANEDSAHFPSLENFNHLSTSAHTHFIKPLPTSAGTPTSTNLMPPSYRNGSTSQDDRGLASFTDGTTPSTLSDDDNTPRSVSNMSHNSPVTPRVKYEGEYDDVNIPRGENIYPEVDQWTKEALYFNPGHPQSTAFTSAMQDVFADQIYRPQLSQNFPRRSQPTLPTANRNLSPYGNMHLFANRPGLGNAEQSAPQTGRPFVASERERLPFKSYTTLQEFDGHGTPQQSPVAAMTQAMMGQSRASSGPKSVSPKELMLEDAEVNDDHSNTPLFPSQFDQTPFLSNHRSNPSVPPYGDQNSMLGAPMLSTPTTTGAQIPPQYSFMGNRRRTPSSLHTESDAVPEFPAHLVSMETTVEEGSTEESCPSQQTHSANSTDEVRRPVETSADSGTYTCTYHGCTLRFESPVRLQKHKREAHRHTSPTAGPVSTPTNLADLGSRSSQAGPHKCDRINPSTGKVCNSIFSRPYDLTRHEDTIHNARKHKVRCHLCTEEKTFSRNDALTRHMRVVHPDVDWPGKSRRGKGMGL